MKIQKLFLPTAWLSDDWFSSPIAATFLFIGALFVIALTACYNVDLSKLSGWQANVTNVLGGIAAIAILSLYWCMWAYWTRIDDSTPAAKRVWFAILLVGVVWGSALYYFSVYLPQVLRRRRRTEV